MQVPSDITLVSCIFKHLKLEQINACDIANDVWNYAFVGLEPQDILRFGSTCQYFHIIAEKSIVAWVEINKQRWHLPPSVNVTPKLALTIMKLGSGNHKDFISRLCLAPQPPVHTVHCTCTHTVHTVHYTQRTLYTLYTLNTLYTLYLCTLYLYTLCLCGVVYYNNDDYNLTLLR